MSADPKTRFFWIYQQLIPDKNIIRASMIFSLPLCPFIKVQISVLNFGSETLNLSFEVLVLNAGGFKVCEKRRHITPGNIYTILRSWIRTRNCITLKIRIQIFFLNSSLTFIHFNCYFWVFGSTSGSEFLSRSGSVSIKCGSESLYS